MKRTLLSLLFLVALGTLSYAGGIQNLIVDLASQVTGTLPTANGGTGSTTMEGALITPTGSSTSDTLADLVQCGIARSINVRAASYTLVMEDQCKFVSMNSTSVQTITIPSNSVVPFPIGTEIPFVQSGSGELTIVAGSGVIINHLSSGLTMSGQYATGSVKKTDTDTWIFAGAAP